MFSLQYALKEVDDEIKISAYEKQKLLTSFYMVANIFIKILLNFATWRLEHNKKLSR